MTIGFDSFMVQLIQFLQNNWLSLVSGIVGVVGTAYGYLSWKSGAKQKKAYAYLFDIAEKNIDKKVTEEQLAEGKKQVAEASARIEALQEKIRSDIPKAARRAVLNDRLRTQIEVMHQHLDSVQRLKNELAAIGTPSELPAELLRSIEAEIEPEYLIREKRSRLKTNLSILTAGAAISSAALPYDIGRFVSLALLILAIPFLAVLVKLSIKELPRTDATITKKWLAGCSISTGCVSLVTSIAFFILAITEPSSTEIALYLGFILLSASALLIFSGARTFDKLKKTKLSMQES